MLVQDIWWHIHSLMPLQDIWWHIHSHISTFLEMLSQAHIH
uniref:Uncharacterized protein n=1 Tax=Arundo donax TaxID=35708 RepID=A0A0A9HA27_ARUDO